MIENRYFEPGVNPCPAKLAGKIGRKTSLTVKDALIVMGAYLSQNDVEWLSCKTSEYSMSLDKQSEQIVIHKEFKH